MDAYNNFQDFCNLVYGRELTTARNRMYTQGTYNDLLNSIKPDQMYVSNGCGISTIPVPAPMKPNISGMKADWTVIDDYVRPKEKCKGKEPMRYENNAIATVAAPKSDIATQREYLLERLRKAEYAKGDELIKHFHIYQDNAPKSPQQLIDMIKDNKYTVDTDRFDRANKKPGYYSIFDGLIWDGPKPDRDGYEAALTERETQKTAAKDAIMVFSAEDGLKAVQAFEAWMPEGKAN